MHFYKRCIFFLFLFPFCSLWAILIGNPAQPILQKSGIIQECPSWFSLRAAYFDDYVYRQRFHDEYKIQGLPHSKTHIKFSTEAALITMNFANRVDFYGIFGGSRIQLDREVFTKRQFAWGAGGKLIILHEGKFRVGIDAKYFESDQKPLYFSSEGLAYNIVTDFILKYSEIQTALGMSYRTGPISPYVYCTYLITKIEPHPSSVLVRLPQMPEVADLYLKSQIGQRRWGFTVGATLVDCRKMTITLESRLFNQNAIDVNGEVRF